MGLAAFNRARRLAAQKAIEEARRAQEAAGTPKTLDKMTVPELRAYAEEHGIDLGDVKKKADILTVIKQAEAVAEAGEPTLYDGGGERDSDPKDDGTASDDGSNEEASKDGAGDDTESDKADDGNANSADPDESGAKPDPGEV